MSSARTSFLRCSLASSCSIFWSLASSTALDLRPLSKASMAVLEELLEPVVKLVGVDVEFIAQVGDGDLVEEVPFEDGDLLGAGEMTTLLAVVHDETSVQVKLTRTERFSRFD